MSPVATLIQPVARPFPDGLSLPVSAFAALIGTAESEEMLGLARGEDVLPKAVRRRFSLYDQLAARCILGLAAEGVDEDIVFASRYGNMGVTLDLLTQVVGGELLSPAKFSVSVHNAAAGAASQIARNRAGHTAVSALERSAAAGLTEAWMRIAEGAPSVIFVYSDLPLMQPYAPFDEPGPGVTLAMRFSAGSSDEAHQSAAHRIEDGREGAIACARALASGIGGVSWVL